MSEDYTYTPATDWRKRAQEANQIALGMEAAANEQRQRRQQLERALAQADSNMVALAARNAELAARLAELEPSGFAMTHSALVQHVHQLAHENAELRARLDAVPEYVRYLVRWRAGDGHVLDFDEWYTATHTAQPDDTDAPLKLAAIDDEDGDL